MTWEQFEKLIYAEAAYVQKRDAIAAAISRAVGKKSADWDNWPGTRAIAVAIIRETEL